MNIENLSDREEIVRFEQALGAFDSGQIDAERFTAVRLQQGVYGQRQQGVNMLRIKIPGGRLVADQLDAIADVVEKYAQHDVAHVTTRQSIQVHFIPLGKTPAAMHRLADAGLTTREACGNTIRNMTACPLAGVCPKEHVNVGHHVKEATAHFLRNPLNQQLPRKFKISFSGCEADCAQAMMHDCGLIAMTKHGQQGFSVRAGGGLGHKPRESIVVEEFIPESELLFALEALVSLHNRYSDRTKRAKSRLKFLVERFGSQGFLEKYREEFERTRQALAIHPFPKGQWREPAGDEIPGPGAPRTLFAQHKTGLFALPVELPTGEVSSAKLRGLSRLMRTHGLNLVHTTQDQNLIIPNVTGAILPLLRIGLASLDLHEPATGKNVVACPGTSTCRLGITASTLAASRLSGGSADLRIRVSGCHNGCAQPETGDIGIYGEGKRIHGRLVPHYQMFFAGNGIGNGSLAIKGPSLPAARIEEAISRVQAAHLESGHPSFFVWARSLPKDYFGDLLADLAEVKEEDLKSVMKDHGDESEFRVLQLGGGECAGASQTRIGANFFEAAHERKYRSALEFQRKYPDAAQCNEAILRLLGAGLAQLKGEHPQHDLEGLSLQLRELFPGEISSDFSDIVERFAQRRDTTAEELAHFSKAVDGWTRKVSRYATEADAQLDLTESSLLA